MATRFTVLDSANAQHKIRLASIDAPEKKQPFDKLLKKVLSDMIYAKQDRYGRTIGKVLLNNENINLEQIKREVAWFYKEYQNELNLDDRLAYLHTQQEAENNKVGLWQDSEAIPP